MRNVTRRWPWNSVNNSLVSSLFTFYMFKRGYSHNLTVMWKWNEKRKNYWQQIWPLMMFLVDCLTATGCNTALMPKCKLGCFFFVKRLLCEDTKVNKSRYAFVRGTLKEFRLRICPPNQYNIGLTLHLVLSKMHIMQTKSSNPIFIIPVYLDALKLILSFSDGN